MASSSGNSNHISKLYHEAKRRAALSQPIIEYTTEGSLLLTAPNNIIFELIGTILKEISEEKLFHFITENLTSYLHNNWTNKITQRAIKRLRREQAVDIKAGITNIPIIGKVRSKDSSKQSQDAASTSASRSTSATQKSPPINYKESERQQAIKQVYEHMMWRIRSNNVTQITSLLVKQALDDGYKKGKLKALLYDDVVGCFQDWRSVKLIKLYAFGNAPANDQKLLLSSTQFGDITKLVANYIDGSEKKQKPDLLRKLAGALRDKTKNCMFITNDIDDAIMSIQTGSIRCALVVDRLKIYESVESLQQLSPSIEFLVTSGKLYFISSLNCVQFAPDPTSDNCC